MGCFDSNCCLTGLPLHHGDPIRAALIMKGDTYDKHMGIHVVSNWQFWTPPVLSEYNDYGNLEWDMIPKKEKPVLELLLKMIVPVLEDHEEYSQNVFLDKNKFEIPVEKIWDHCLRGDIELDPDRQAKLDRKAWAEAGNTEPAPFTRASYPFYMNNRRPQRMNGWMCHAWAWDHIHNMNSFEHPRLEKQLHTMFMTSKRIEEYLELKYGTEEKTSDEAMREWYKLSQSDDFSHIICGEQGAFSHNLRFVIKDLFEINPEWYQMFLDNEYQLKDMLRSTVRVVQNMFYLRKIIIPVSICGEQYEQFEYFGDWTQLVADKVQQIIKKRDREYGDDEE